MLPAWMQSFVPIEPCILIRDSPLGSDEECEDAVGWQRKVLGKTRLVHSKIGAHAGLSLILPVISISRRDGKDLVTVRT